MKNRFLMHAYSIVFYDIDFKIYIYAVPYKDMSTGFKISTSLERCPWLEVWKSVLPLGWPKSGVSS